MTIILLFQYISPTYIQKIDIKHFLSREYELDMEMVQNTIYKWCIWS